MAGQTDLGTILANLTVRRRPGTFTLARPIAPVGWDEDIHAMIRESEGTTVVTTVELARSRNWNFDFEAAWLTLEVHTSLEAVGLTATVAEALAAESIPCNVLAGYFHDHLLVPANRAEDAVACVTRLRTG